MAGGGGGAQQEGEGGGMPAALPVINLPLSCPPNPFSLTRTAVALRIAIPQQRRTQAVRLKPVLVG